MRWNHLTGRSEVLVDATQDPIPGKQDALSEPSNVAQYSVSSDGKKLIVSLVRMKAQGAYGTPVYDLALLDLTSNQLVSLATFAAPLLDTEISPDGQWVAYIVKGSTQGAATGLRRGLAAPAQHSANAAGGPIEGVLNLLSLAAPQQPRALGVCSDVCLGFSWTPDSKALVWNDGRGVWLDRLVEGSVQKIAVDWNAKVSNEPSSNSWSPDGRFLLAWSRDSKAEGWGIIDTQTMHVGKLPDTHLFPTNIHAIWLKDGRLFVVRSAVGAVGEFWRMDPTTANLVVLDRSLPISANPGALAFAPAQLDDNQVAFILDDPDLANSMDAGSYLIDLQDYLPRHVGIPTPAFAPSDVASGQNTIDNWGIASWSPDGKGAIVLNQFITTRGVFLSSTPELFGTDFTWTP
jgi:dipeptidyl aminopeptidase/acylaminoacyl peptidase